MWREDFIKGNEELIKIEMTDDLETNFLTNQFRIKENVDGEEN